MRSSNRNGTIDCLRFLFCVLIVLRHTMHALPKGGYVIMPGGGLGVEFFFIVSGYLMARSASKRLSGGPTELGADTTAFMKRKLTGMLPEIAISGALCLGVISLTLIPSGPAEIIGHICRRLWNPLLLSGAGFGSANEMWYISVMMIVMLAYYPLLLKHFQVFVRIASPLIAILTIGYLYKGLGSLLDPTHFAGVVYKGMIRGAGEIALGVALYPAISALQKLSLTDLAKTLISVCNILCWGFTVVIITFHQNNTLDIIALLLITVGTVLSFSHQGRFAAAFDNRVSDRLGALSLTLYLSHYWVAMSVNNIYNLLAEKKLFGFGADFNFDYFAVLGAYLAATALACAFTWFAANYIRAHQTQIAARLRSRLIARQPQEDQNAAFPREERR